MEYCKEHTKTMSLLREIKITVDITRLDIKSLNKKVDSSFKTMNQHLKENNK